MKFELNNPTKTALLVIDMENDFVKEALKKSLPSVIIRLSSTA